MKPSSTFFDQFLAPAGDGVQGDGGGGEHPQPQRLAPLRPGRFIGVQQTAGQHCVHQLVFRRGQRGGGFVERLVDRADAQFHPQPLAQEFLNSRPRQPEPQAQGDDQPRQAGADHPPFAQFHPGQQRIDFTPTRRRPGVMPQAQGTS